MKAESDFSKAKRATEIPHLNQLREEGGKISNAKCVDDMPSEYTREMLGSGVRGKYYEDYCVSHEQVH